MWSEMFVILNSETKYLHAGMLTQWDFMTFLSWKYYDVVKWQMHKMLHVSIRDESEAIPQ